MVAILKQKKAGLPHDDLNTKLIALENQADNFSQLEEDAIIRPLYFFADVLHPETIALKHQYEQERHHIQELQKKDNFLDLVLNRLATSE